MKTITSDSFAQLLLLGAVAIGLLGCGGKKGEISQQSLDKGITILRHFVVDTQDRDMGFSSAQEAESAVIDTGGYASVYLLSRDSMLHSSDFTGDDLFIHTDQRLYPVFSAQKKLCSTIEFDSSETGWEPSEYQDSNGICDYVNYRIYRSVKGMPNLPSALLMVPFLQGQFVLEFYKPHVTFVIIPNYMYEDLGSFFPSWSGTDYYRAPAKEFLQAARDIVASKAGKPGGPPPMKQPVKPVKQQVKPKQQPKGGQLHEMPIFPVKPH